MKWLKGFVSVVMVFSLSIICLLSSASAAGSVPPVETVPVGDTATPQYLPPDDFFALEDDYSISTYAIQSTPNTPVTSASGLKGILIDLFGEYSPQITQLRYQSNTSTNYTYVNNIDRDVPWIASACIFGLVLFCVFRLGGVALSKL